MRETESPSKSLEMGEYARRRNSWFNILPCLLLPFHLLSATPLFPYSRQKLDLQINQGARGKGKRVAGSYRYGMIGQYCLVFSNQSLFFPTPPIPVISSCFLPFPSLSCFRSSSLVRSVLVSLSFVTWWWCVFFFFILTGLFCSYAGYCYMSCIMILFAPSLWSADKGSCWLWNIVEKTGGSFDLLVDLSKSFVNLAKFSVSNW